MQIMPIGGKRSEKFGGLGRRAESVQTDKVQTSDSGYSWHIVVRQIKSTTIRHFILTGIAEKRSNKAYYKHLIRQIK